MNELINCPTFNSNKLKRVYSKSDKLELVTKFLDLPAMPFYLDSYITFALTMLMFVSPTLVSIFAGDSLSSLESQLSMSFISIVGLITTVYLINNANHRKNTIVAKQTFAAANKKKIAGHYLKTVINTKKN